MLIHQLTIEYPDEVLWALSQNPDEFEREARKLLAFKLYETGRLSSGLAARLAGLSRVAFLFALQEVGLSPFGQTPAEIQADLEHARAARHL